MQTLNTKISKILDTPSFTTASNHPLSTPFESIYELRCVRCFIL